VIEMRVGFDLDGVLTPIGRYNPNKKLAWWLFLGLIFIIPNKKMVELLRNLAKQSIIIIISARPERLKILTILWLRLHKIPFHNLFCVGLGKDANQRKLDVIKLMKIGKFFDDNPETVEYLKEYGINARLP